MVKLLSVTLALSLMTLSLNICGSDKIAISSATSAPTVTTRVYSLLMKEITRKTSSSEVLTEENFVEFTRGTWKDNVYTSDLAGFTFTMPKGFTAVSDKLLAKKMKINKRYF